jgi:hypothetical protein
VFPATVWLAEEFAHWAGLSPWTLIGPLGTVLAFFLLLGISAGDRDEPAEGSSSA